jgi:hypothetical protein
MAIGHNFMVDPAHRHSLTWLKLSGIVVAGRESPPCATEKTT